MFEEFDADNDENEGANGADTALIEKLTLAPPASSHEYWGDDKLEQHLLSLFNAGRLPHGMIFSGRPCHAFSVPISSVPCRANIFRALP